MHTRYLLVTAAILLLAGSGSAVEQTMNIGESATVTATVTNPLDVPDIVMVEIDGDAITTDQAAIELLANTTSTGCNEERSRCRLYLAPHASTPLPITLTADQAGTRAMTVTATSTTTGERSRNRLNIRVTRPGILSQITAWFKGLL